jgi:hypothetical protein
MRFGVTAAAAILLAGSAPAQEAAVDFVRDVLLLNHPPGLTPQAQAEREILARKAGTYLLSMCFDTVPDKPCSRAASILTV